MDREELLGLLRAIVANDRSRPYEYREMRGCDGEKPPNGARWMTPRELAERAIQGLGGRP